MSDGRKIVTTNEALAMLADGEDIHVFSNPSGGIMLGADWSRHSVEEFIRANEIELSGPMATSMGHGLCHNGERRLFFATKAVTDATGN